MSNNLTINLLGLKPIIEAVQLKHSIILAQTLRQITLIPLLVRCYQKRYPEFATIDENEIKRLQIACLFTAIAHKSLLPVNTSVYAQNYQQAAEHFKSYAHHDLSQLFSTSQIEKYSNFICYVGQNQCDGVEMEILNYAMGLERLRYFAPLKLEGIKHFHLKHLGLTTGEALFTFYDQLLKATGESPLSSEPFHHNGDTPSCQVDVGLMNRCNMETTFCLQQLNTVMVIAPEF